jgi:hypothetical protein
MRPDGWSQWKISTTPSGYRTRDLPAFSAVPQPTTCKIMWTVSYVMLLNFTYKHLIWLIMIFYLWFDPQLISPVILNYTGLGVREIKRFVGYRQYKTKYRQKDLFSKKKKDHCFMGEWMRKTELLVSKLPWNCQNNHFSYIFGILVQLPTPKINVHNLWISCLWAYITPLLPTGDYLNHEMR